MLAEDLLRAAGRKVPAGEEGVGGRGEEGGSERGLEQDEEGEEESRLEYEGEVLRLEAAE